MKNSAKTMLATAGVALLLIGSAAAAYAHGVIINYNIAANGQVELYAEFDTGEAMTEAQVTIYAPQDPLTPWLVGTADSEGRFLFTLDPEQLGTWDIQYRKAGHGDMIHFELAAGMIDPALVNRSAIGQPAEMTQPASPPPAAPASPASVVSGGSSGSSGFTSLQILLMSASVIWGFIGTALYFANKSAAPHNHEAAHGHPH